MCVDKPDESPIARVLRCINRSSDALEPTISYSTPPTESPQSEKQNMAEFRDDSGIGTYGSDQEQVQSTYRALHLKHTPKQYSPASSAPQTTQSKPEHLQRAFVTLRVALASGELTPDEVLAELSDEKITEMRHILQHLAF